MKTKHFETKQDWENWLAANDKEKELWLVYYKKHTQKTSISYEDSVNVALSYGWIDSLIKKLDEDRFARKFNPRKANSVWSESNKRRVQELIDAGKMKPAGLRLVEAAKANGNWNKVIVPPKIDLTVPDDFENALAKQPKAKAAFEALSNSHKKQYLTWIKMAKRAETRERHIKQSIEMLLKNKKLGLK